ncbi:MAG: heme-binding protein [Planctomycetota bacterium]
MPTPPAAAELIAAIDNVVDGDKTESTASFAALAESVPPQSPVREAIDAGDLAAAREMLAFRPLDEAPLPEGFPAFTPVGVIEVKQYPAYRKAEGRGFWPLFRHIQQRAIPMTTPVEMTRAGARGDAPMAFLYQNTSVGETGDDGGGEGVTVTDAEATLAVSLGMRGGMNTEKTIDAKRRLDAWLADNPDYRRNGMTPFRMFGYNSPMVGDAERYWEAQVLVERVPTSGGGE